MLQVSLYKGVPYPGVAFMNTGHVRLFRVYVGWTGGDQRDSRFALLVDEAMKKKAKIAQAGTARFRELPCSLNGEYSAKPQAESSSSGKKDTNKNNNKAKKKKTKGSSTKF
jgi:hypothetical protein